MTLGWRHLCKKCGIEHPRDIECSPIPGPFVELTEIGEQYVIPGCERHEKPAGAQLKLWESTK